MFVYTQKVRYKVRISDWSLDVCSFDLHLSLRETRRERIEADDVPSLHRAFGVSFGAMLVRLKTIRILGPRRFGELKNIPPVEEAVTHGDVVAAWERSEERRVGKGIVSTCSARWSPPQQAKKAQI